MYVTREREGKQYLTDIYNKSIFINKAIDSLYSLSETIYKSSDFNVGIVVFSHY